MKKIISLFLIIVMCGVCFCGCGGSTSNATAKSKEENYSFKVDGAYLSLSGATDPTQNGLSLDQFFQYNPSCLLENKSDNDDVEIIVFLSIASSEKKDDDLQLESLYGDFEWEYNNVTKKDALDLNNRDQATKYFGGKYKTVNQYHYGAESDYVLYGGSNDRIGIVGMFFVSYHDYKKATSENGNITINYKGLKCTLKGSTIKVVKCPQEIGNYIKNGFIE